MTTCACCGRQLSSQTSNDVFAEQTLLESCHQADLMARNAGSSTIEIAHLVLALMQTDTGRNAFASHQIDIVHLTQMAARQIESVTPSATDVAPEASPGFLQALRRAERTAAAAGRNTVTVRCVVDALLGPGPLSDNGLFLKVTQQVKRAQAPTGDRRRHKLGRRDDGAKSRRNEDADRQRETRNRQSRDTAANDDMKETRTARQAAAAYNNDPFQLRSDHSIEPTANQAAERNQSKLTSSSAGVTVTEVTAEDMKRLDNRLRDVQQQLILIAAKVGSMSSAQEAAAHRDERIKGDGARTRRSTSHREPSSVPGPSTQDWERITRLLERLDKDAHASAGQRTSRPAHKRSARQLRHRSKLRIRGARQERQRTSQHRYQRPDRYDSEPRSNRDHGQYNGIEQSRSLKSTKIETEQPGDWEVGDDIESKRFYLEMSDEIVRAPSIGPRTAEHLTPHGIEQVRDLLAADAADLAERINVRHISTQRIEDWQMQARLVCTVPQLRGTHAQLLVGAGYTTPGDICAVSGDVLSADILKFASTRDGQRILRSGSPPEMEKILKWAQYAGEAELDRAA